MDINDNLHEELPITQKYVNFILDNVIKDTYRVQLYKPTEDNKVSYTKLGPVAHCLVKIDVLEKYTRSAKLKLSFDKYIIENVFFMPFNSSPDSINIKTFNKIESIVNKTFIEDNRSKDIAQMYVHAHERIYKKISFNEELIKTDINK